MIRPCLSSMLIVTLAGCQSLVPESRMEEAELDVPDQWAASEEADAGIDNDWVSRFRDPGLTRVVDEALQNNRDLRAAAARLEQARQQILVSRSAGLPTADLNFGGSRQKQNFIGFPVGGGPETGMESDPGGVSSNLFNQFNLSLDVTWEVDLWGRIRAGQSAATADAEASAADYRAASASLAAQVAKTWFALAEAQQQADLAEKAEEVFRQTAEAVRERFEGGQDEGSASQLRLAETDVATARASRLEREQSLSSLVRQLEVLLGRRPSGSLETPAELVDVPKAPPSGLPSELLLRRPDVLAAERRFASAGRRLSEARRALFPRLSLTGSAGQSSDELSNLLDSDFGVWNLVGNAVQPILTGGRLRAEARSRFAVEEEALANLQQSVLTAFGEVETALAVDGLLAQRETAIRLAARVAREADEAAREEFITGVGDLLTVLAAQSRLLDTLSLSITLRRLRLDNRVDLHLALGGDYRVHAAP